MASVLEPFDTPMLDYHPDTDVQMHTTSDSWFHDEAVMEEESLFPLTKSFSDGDLVDVEVEMENYHDQESHNPEYEMVDEPIDYPAAIEPEDVVVMDASHHTHAQEDSTLGARLPGEMPPQLHPQPVESFLQSSLIDAEALPTVEDPYSSQILSTETHMHLADPSSEALVSTNSISEPELVETTVVSDRVAAPEPLFVDESSTHPATPGLETEHVSSAVQDPPVSHIEGESSETTALTEPTRADEPLQTGTLEPEHKVAEQVESVEESSGVVAEEFVSTGSSEIVGPVEPDSEDQQIETQEEHGFSETDPHEVSEGVYIDPPPAVLLSFALMEHPEVCLFNQPPLHASPSLSTTEPSSYAVLLSEQPTLYYEPLSTVFEALRSDSELASVADLSHVELVLDAYDLQLTVSEDNIFARETSLHDLNVLHDGSDFSGPLRLRLQAVSPRFIVRYRMLQDQIQRLNMAEAGEEYNVDELNDSSIQETTEQEHGPDYTEENSGDYSQEQDGDGTAETREEHASGVALLDPAKEGDAENASDELVVLSGDNLQQESDDAAQDREIDESVEVTDSYDDGQQYAEEESYEAGVENSAYSSTDAEGDESHTQGGAEEADPATEGHEQDPDTTQNNEAPENEESYDLEDEKQDNTDNNVETSTALEASSELHLPEAELHGTEESYQGDDLYYDEDADAEWDGTEYDEVAIGEGAGDTTFDPEAEPETASVESSVTLSSRNSKRSIHDVDEDEGENIEASVQSSPGSKRARTD